ncbi:MAG: 50S ribosomal protein L23 [Candidatus Pacebacteria bacterium]|nr:50S ribosomal protein L23 [Candidatus Paceibacterota bacterium]
MGILNKIIKTSGKEKDDEKKATDTKKKDTTKDAKKKVVSSSENSKSPVNKKSTGKAGKVKKVSVDKMPENYFDIIVKPHISEKTFNLSQEDKYVFIVSNGSNKTEIKKAVKSIYGVSVVSVNIINIHSRMKRFRGRMGLKSGYRKAIVKLAKGDKIDLMKENK